MTSPVAGRSNSPPTYYSEKWESLNIVAKIFKISIPDSYEEASEKCFNVALQACKEKKWHLLKDNALSHVTDCFGRTLLMHAVFDWDNESVVHLIRYKIGLFARDNEGNDTAHFAALKGAEKYFDILRGNVDFSAINKSGKTPLHIAIDADQPDTVHAFLEKGIIRKSFTLENGIQMSELPYAIMLGRDSCVSVLLPRADLKENTPKIGNLLHVAINFSQFKILKALFKFDPIRFKELLDGKNDDGLNPLSLAAEMGDVDAIKFLYNQGASLETIDKNGRSPLHHAAIARQYGSICALVLLGAKLNQTDEYCNIPIYYVRGIEDQEAKRCNALLEDFNLKMNFSPNWNLGNLPPENITFKGGGPKGVAYAGVILGLEEKGLLDGIKRVAGTSAGAITAAALALNFSGQEISNLLNELDLKKFLDHPFADFNQLFKGKYDDISKTVNILYNFICKILKNPMKVISGPINTIWSFTGLCEGEAFREWVEEQIANQVKKVTGERIDFLTFGELNNLILQGHRFRHLHIFGTRIDEPGILQFSSEDPLCSDVIISDAIRISMGIPGIFKPHKLYVKKNRERIRSPNKEIGIDGGLIYNSPSETFDRKKFQTNKKLGHEEDCPRFNKKTLVINLFSSTEPEVEPKDIKTVKDLFIGVLLTFRKAEGLLRTMNPYHKKRVINVDVKEVGTLNFDLSDNEKQVLINSGKQAVFSYFENNPIQDLDALFQLPGGLKRLQDKISLRGPLEQFSGRRELLSLLEKSLVCKDWKPLSPTKIFNLCGPGGIGKTQLAITFGNRHIKDFSFIWFIHTDSEALYNQGYRQLASALKIHICSESIDLIIDKVHQTLSQGRLGKPFLLIFDNVEKKKPVPDRGGFILATSQYHDIYPNPIPVPPFTLAEAKELLYCSLSEHDILNYESLFKKFEGYPLFLDHSRHYISKNRMTIDRYLETLNEYPRHLYKKEETSSYPHSFADAYNLTFSKLKNENPEAFNLLQLLPYFNPDVINLKLFETYKSENRTFPSQIYEWMGDLENLSLVNYDKEKNTYYIHRNIQKILKASHESESIMVKQANSAASLLKISFEMFEPYEPNTWEIGRLCYAHVQWQMKQSFWQYIDKRTKYILLSQSGEWLRAVHTDFQKSLSFHVKAINIIQDLNGKVSYPDFIRVLNNYGMTLYSYGKYHHAIKLFEKALEICKRMDKKACPGVISVLNNLGVTLNFFGKHSQASAHFNEAFQIAQQIYDGNPDILIAQTINNLGDISLLSSKDYEAIDSFEAARRMITQIYGEKLHPETAHILSRLGKAKNHIGKYYEAMDLHKQSLHIYKKIYGDMPHPSIAQVLNRIGMTWFSLNQVDKTIHYYEKALKMYKQIYGNHSHPYIAQVYFNLGNVYLHLENHFRAIDYYDKALSIFKLTCKDSAHLAVAMILKNLGNICIELKNSEKAKEYFNEALIQFKEIYEENPIVSNLLHLGDIECLLENPSMSIEYYLQALNYYEKNESENPHQMIGLISAKIGYAWKKLVSLDPRFPWNRERLNKALSNLKEALKAYKKIYNGISHQDIADILYDIGVIYFTSGNTASAISYFEKALESYESIDIFTFSKSIGTTHHALGNAWFKEKEFRKAKRHFQIAFDIHNRDLGPDHNLTLRSKRMMIVSKNNSCSIQ